MDRGAWQATVHGAAESRTRLCTLEQEHTVTTPTTCSEHAPCPPRVVSTQATVRRLKLTEVALDLECQCLASKTGGESPVWPIPDPRCVRTQKSQQQVGLESAGTPGLCPDVTIYALWDPRRVPSPH